MTVRESWLHGWPRMWSEVLMGTGVFCAGCGHFWGITCVAFEDGWEAPGPEPDWPFDEETCPLPSHQWGKEPEPAPWPRGKARPLP